MEMLKKNERTEKNSFKYSKWKILCNVIQLNKIAMIKQNFFFLANFIIFPFLNYC